MPGVLPGKRIIMDFADRISGIDYKRAQAVAKHFSSVREMINASVEEWMKIPGIGKVLAKSAVETVTAETGREKQAITPTSISSNLDPFGD
jgi:ERCC4-type nuclease